MMGPVPCTLAAVLTCLCWSQVVSIPVTSRDPCKPDKLTVYKVVLHTYWSRKQWPKHYPEWRPPAQWSKLVGLSHNQSFVLFRLGKKASEGVKIFAQTGKSDVLDEESQGEGGIYDEFYAPPIRQGEGKTDAEFFVDGNHSRVSLISRMVPSPDWFIGIDSFDLCADGKWIDSVTIEVDPIDAGTDNGFTFTSPNWPTEPQGIIFRMTSTYPYHPASSFYYPHLKRLPPIATFQFLKVKEYELSEVFDHSMDKGGYEVIKMEYITHSSLERTSNNVIDDVKTAISNTKAVSSTPKIDVSNIKTTPIHAKPNHATHHTKPNLATHRYSHHSKTSSGGKDPEDKLMIDPDLGYNRHGADVVEKGDKKAIINNIVDVYRKKKKSKKNRKGRRKRRKDIKKIRPPRDCRVSEWSEWGPCSKTCGIGDTRRTRTVLKHSRRGGKPCPILVSSKWCGSASSCPRTYFNW